MNALTIHYEPDPSDEVGRLWFKVQTKQFSGAAFFWSNTRELPDIARALEAYPITEAIVEKWGYNTCEGRDLILFLRIDRVGHKGELSVRIEVADHLAPDQRLAVTFATTYNDVDRFRTELLAIAEGQATQAVLKGN